MRTVSKENYLKTILIEEIETGGNVSANTLANKLSISQAAVSEMTKKLSIENLLVYKKYYGVRTTSKGRKVASEIIRKHRLWESFLVKVLNYNWDEVHDEAELLEHSTSNELINRIEEFLDFPTVDPHGYPIPDKEGSFPNQPKLINLRNAKIGLFYKIARVSDDNLEVLKYLTQIGFNLNEKIFIENFLEFDKTVIVKINNSTHALSNTIAEKVDLFNVKED